jgi:SAM-dependent methyltransferase
MTPTPEIRRRTDYRSQRRQDRWMVPLLEGAIDEALREFAAPLRRARCLDVGCGGQPLRTRIESLGLHYSSLDVAQNEAKTVEHLGVIDGSLPVSLANERFDFIVCTEVLEHVANWPAAFENLTELLAPGGRLLITCPHIWVPHEEPHDYFRPTSWALERHANQSGLRTLRLRRLGDGYDVLGTVLAAVRVTAPRSQPWMWLIAGPLSLVRKLALAVMSLSFIRRVLPLETSLYLNTLAVFEKPAAAGSSAS